MVRNYTVFLNSLSVNAENGETELYGKDVADLQSDIVCEDGKITGTLKYVTGYTGFSGEVSEQSGNYLALKMGVNTTGVTTTISIVDSNGTRTVTLDSDMNVVARITDKDDQVIVVTARKDDIEITKTYSLKSLTCETE